MQFAFLKHALVARKLQNTHEFSDRKTSNRDLEISELRFTDSTPCWCQTSLIPRHRKPRYLKCTCVCGPVEMSYSYTEAGQEGAQESSRQTLFVQMRIHERGAMDGRDICVLMKQNTTSMKARTTSGRKQYPRERTRGKISTVMTNVLRKQEQGMLIQIRENTILTPCVDSHLAVAGAERGVNEALSTKNEVVKLTL